MSEVKKWIEHIRSEPRKPQSLHMTEAAWKLVVSEMIQSGGELKDDVKTTPRKMLFGLPVSICEVGEITPDRRWRKIL